MAGGLHTGLHPPWKKGESGNPKGRPKGLQFRITKDGLEYLIKQRANPLMECVAIAMAKDDDGQYVNNAEIRLRAWKEVLPYTCYRAESMEFVERLEILEGLIRDSMGQAKGVGVFGFAISEPTRQFSIEGETDRGLEGGDEPGYVEGKGIRIPDSSGDE